MRSRMQKKKELSEEQLEIVEAKDFFDRISPGISHSPDASETVSDASGL